MVYTHRHPYPYSIACTARELSLLIGKSIEYFKVLTTNHNFDEFYRLIISIYPLVCVVLQYNNLTRSKPEFVPNGVGTAPTIFQFLRKSA